MARVVHEFATKRNWRLIVAGDKKTLEDWNCASIYFISTNAQASRETKFSTILPWNQIP